MKAFLFLVLSLALFHQAAFGQIAGPWFNVNPDTVNKNPAIQEYLIFGAEYAIQQGIEDGTIADAEYDIINIFSVREQYVDGTNYEFVVEIADDAEYYVKLTYVVWVQIWKNSKKVTSYEFSPLLQGEADIGTNSEFDFLPEEIGDGSRVLAASSDFEGEDGEMAMGGEWTPVNPNELNTNTDLQNAYNYGLQQVIRTSIINGSLPRQAYQDKVYMIESQVVDGYNYKFVVKVTGNGGADAILIFEVYSQSWTNTLELLSSQVIPTTN